MECVGPVDTVRRMSTECSRIPSPTLGSSKCFLLAYVTYRWVVELQFVSAVWFNHVATCLVSPTQFSTKSSSQQEEQPQPLHHGPAFKKQPKIITCTPITQNTQPNGQLTNDQPNTPSTSQPANQPKKQQQSTIIYQQFTSIQPASNQCLNQHSTSIYQPLQAIDLLDIACRAISWWSSKVSWAFWISWTKPAWSHERRNCKGNFLENWKKWLDSQRNYGCWSSDCTMPQTLWWWLSGTSFLVTLTVLCGLPLCWDG